MSKWLYRLSLLLLLALSLESLPYGTVLGGTESWPLTVHRGWVIHRPLAWTFGPLSWFVTPHKVLGFFHEQARAQLLLALFCSLALCKAMSLQDKPWRWASLILVLAMPMGWVRWGPAEILLLIALAAFALAAHDEGKGGGIFYTCLLCLFAVLAGLVKASLIPAGILCVLAMCRRRKLWPLYTWAGCFGVVWLLCGFNLLGLPQWVWQSLSLVRGYDQAMVMPLNPALLRGLLATLLLSALAILWSPRLSWPLKGALVAIVFIGWKASVVRADSCHLPSLIALAPVVVALAQGRKGASPLAIAAITVALATTHWLDGGYLNIANRQMTLTGTFAGNLNALLYPAKPENSPSERSGLPANFQQRIGTNTIDAFNFDCTPVRGLNFTPRPAPISYATWSRTLERANLRFYQQTPPAFVLFSLHPADSHFAPAEDALLLRELWFNYRPALDGGGFILLERNPKPYTISLELVSKGKLKAGGKLTLTNTGAMWLELDCPSSLKEVLKRTFYHDTLVKIQANGGSYDCPRQALAAGFMACPLLLGTPDIVKPSHNPQFSLDRDANYRLYRIKSLQ